MVGKIGCKSHFDGEASSCGTPTREEGRLVFPYEKAFANNSDSARMLVIQVVTGAVLMQPPSAETFEVVQWVSPTTSSRRKRFGTWHHPIGAVFLCSHTAQSNGLVSCCCCELVGGKAVVCPSIVLLFDTSSPDSW